MYLWRGEEKKEGGWSGERRRALVRLTHHDRRQQGEQRRGAIARAGKERDDAHVVLRVLDSGEHGVVDRGLLCGVAAPPRERAQHLAAGFIPTVREVPLRRVNGRPDRERPQLEMRSVLVPSLDKVQRDVTRRWTVDAAVDVLPRHVLNYIYEGEQVKSLAEFAQNVRVVK